MKRFLSILLFVVVTLGHAPTVEAQNNATPELNIALKNADELLKDLKFILKLTKPASQQQWPNIEMMLNFYLVDPNNNQKEFIDKKKPIRVDLLFDKETLKYRSSFPVPNLKDFEDGILNPSGITIKKVLGTLYKCGGNTFDGYMRFVHNYAIFGEERQHLPQNITAPTISIGGLVDRFDLGLQFNNSENGAENRKKWFDDYCKDLLAAVKSKDEESPEDFALRKMLLEQQLEELGRLYAEASELTVGWNTDTGKKEGRLEFEASAIKGTSLAESLSLLGRKPTHFANIQAHDASIFSGRFNLPLDDLRKDNLIEFAGSMKSRAEKDIDEDKARNDDQKATGKKIVGMLHDLIKSNAQAGLFDGFIDVRLNKSGKKTAVGGFRTADGMVVVDLLKLLPASKPGRNADLDVEKAGDISIHKLTIPTNQQEFLAYFVEDDAAYVGTSKDSVWFAAGENALAELKTAIEQVGKENTGNATDPFVNLKVKLKPWIQQRAKRQGAKGDVKLRNQALEAFLPNEDQISFEMKRVEEKITGKLTVQPGILRLAGEIMADFSKETFE